MIYVEFTSLNYENPRLCQPPRHPDIPPQTLWPAIRFAGRNLHGVYESLELDERLIAVQHDGYWRPIDPITNKLGTPEYSDVTIWYAK